MSVNECGPQEDVDGKKPLAHGGAAPLVGRVDRDLYSAGRELQTDGKCLGASSDGTSNGTKVITWDCNNTSSQKWTFHPDGSITNDLSGLCLDVTDIGTANGSTIQLWGCSGGSNQKWTVASDG